MPRRFEMTIVLGLENILKFGSILLISILLVLPTQHTCWKNRALLCKKRVRGITMLFISYCMVHPEQC